MEPIILSILQGMASALGQRLLSPRDRSQPIFVQELAEASARSARAAEASAAAMEQSMRLFIQLVDRQDGFTVRSVEVGGTTRERPEVVVRNRTDGQGPGFSLFELERDIESLKAANASEPTTDSPAPVSRLATPRSGAGFTLDGIDEEIQALRDGV